jgi:hypothetical protein
MVSQSRHSNLCEQLRVEECSVIEECIKHKPEDHKRYARLAGLFQVIQLMDSDHRKTTHVLAIHGALPSLTFTSFWSFAHRNDLPQRDFVAEAVWLYHQYSLLETTGSSPATFNFRYTDSIYSKCMGPNFAHTVDSDHEDRAFLSTSLTHLCHIADCLQSL